MLVFALIADMISSRTIANRDEIQKKLLDSLKLVNRHSKKFLISPHTITLGDEFQAVYSKPDSILSDYWTIQESISPVRLRVAIGYGTIATEINTKSSLGMDGPAFHLARAGIGQPPPGQKKHDWKKKAFLQFYPHEKFTFVNNSLMLYTNEISKWSITTRQVFLALINDKAVETIAQELNITLVAVYKIIQRNNLRDFLNFHDSLVKELNRDR